MKRTTMITTTRSEVLGAHAHVSVWSRGGLAGTLIVAAEDGIALCVLLIPDGSERLDATGGYWRTTTTVAS